MAVCNSIAAGIAINCDSPLIPGVETDILLANKSDIAGYTVDAANPLLVTGITMKTGAQFYKFEGQNDSVEPLSRLVQTRYSDFFEHEARLKVFSNDEDDKLTVEKLIKGLVVALVKGNDGRWELYGKDIGLKAVEFERNPMNQDTGGAYDILLRTSPNSAREPHLPATFFDTDAATTEASIEALLQPAA